MEVSGEGISWPDEVLVSMIVVSVHAPLTHHKPRGAHSQLMWWKCHSYHLVAKRVLNAVTSLLQGAQGLGLRLSSAEIDTHST